MIAARAAIVICVRTGRCSRRAIDIRNYRNFPMEGAMLAKRVIQWTFAFITLLSFSALAQAAQPLVNPAWLKQHLNDKNLVIIDVFDGDKRAAFATGHIPGAVFTDFLHDGWRVKVGAAPGMLPPIKDAEKLIGSFGVDNNSHVVLVPGGREKADFNATARIYWTFKVLGHDEVSILNGGDKAWLADASNPVAKGATSAPAKTFVAKLQPDYIASRDDVKQALEKHDAQFVDARPPAQYEGKAKSPAVRVAGTLPGAVNAPAQDFSTPDGTRLADAATIDRVLAKAGVKAASEQISFCNTGHLGAGTWFVLHEVKGYSKARLYPGSMSDWTSDASLPVVNEPHG
jgi:thiosulfate/3-mercaptopyruvate sulfurtransferase